MGRRAGSHSSHGTGPAPASSHDGTPVRAKEVQAARIDADNANASSLPPENPWTIGLFSVPNTNVIYRACHEPS